MSALGAANYCSSSGKLHDTQSLNSHVSELRARNSKVIDFCCGAYNSEAEAVDKGLESWQNTLETQEKIEESMVKSSWDIIKSSSKGIGGRLVFDMNC